MAGYVNVPHGARPTIGDLPDPQRRAPIPAPNVSSGAQRNYNRSGNPEVNFGGKFKGFERKFTERIDNRLVRKALGNGETDPLNHWAEHASPGISNIRPTPKAPTPGMKALSQNNPSTSVKGAIGPAPRAHGGPAGPTAPSPLGTGPTPAAALGPAPRMWAQPPVPRAQHQYASGPPGELPSSTGPGHPKFAGGSVRVNDPGWHAPLAETTYPTYGVVEKSQQFGSTVPGLRDHPIHKMGAIDASSTTRPRPASRQASFDAKRRAAWNQSDNNAPPTPQM